MNNLVYSMEDTTVSIPYKVEVYHDETLNQYQITIYILGRKVSRMEKSKSQAVKVAKEIVGHLDSAFQYTWEDNS